jgi:hypothetical protein
MEIPDDKDEKMVPTEPDAESKVAKGAKTEIVPKRLEEPKRMNNVRQT